MDSRAALALLALPGVGRKTVLHPRTRALPWRFPLEPGFTAPGLPPRLLQALADHDAVARANDGTDALYLRLEVLGARAVVLGNGDYPTLLARIPDPPPVLFLQGPTPTPRALAVIGTLTPTPAGLKTAERITTHFAELGWTIVSGLARGIDAVAHRTALAVGVPTVAVLAHGLDSTYPPEHGELREKILAAGGTLLSEYPPGVGAKAHQFIVRDRLQAGLSVGVVCVQSGLQDGALHACRAALRQNRLLLAPLPAPPDRHAGVAAGSLRLHADAHGFLGVPTGQVLPFTGREDYVRLERTLDAALAAHQETHP